jgi:mono/diheme cytochrome c family protein
MPILSGSCTGCHGANGGLSVASYADLMKGGKDGAVVKAGDADGSLLIQKVKGTQTIGARMPRGGAPLADDKIKVLSDWVAQGAKDN